ARLEAIRALAGAPAESRAGQVRNELQAQVSGPDHTLPRMAAPAMNEHENRPAGVTPLPGTSAAAVAATQGGVRPPQPVPPEAAKTMLIADQGVTQAAKQAEAAKLDIQTLKSGDVIEGRYK